MAQEKSALKEALSDIFAKNGTLVTGFLAAMILVTGVILVEDPSRWWLGLLLLGSTLVTLLLILNARVVIKATVALAGTILLAAWSFQLGALGSFSLGGGTIWLFSTLASFFTILSVSYIKPSPKSRWLRGLLATVGGFLLTYALGASGVPMEAAGPLGSLGALGFFGALYYLGRGTLSKKKMPPAFILPETLEGVSRDLRPLGWGVRHIKKRQGEGILLWNDEVAYLLTQVTFKRKLGISGSPKRPYLSYEGSSVNPWLFSLLSSLVPTFGVRGADVTLILMDTQDGNGPSKRTVGVQHPDSKAVTPVGILPSRELMKRGDYRKLPQVLQKEWGTYGRRLTKKQALALDMRLPATHPLKEDTPSPQEAPKALEGSQDSQAR